MRLDRALWADLRTALRSVPVRVFLLVQALAGAMFVLRRGPETATSVLLIWAAMALLAFVAWWAGRHPAAHPAADHVPDAAWRSACAVVASLGMLLLGAGIGAPVGLLLLTLGIGGWLWSSLRRRGWQGAIETLTRDPRPFVPLLLLIGLPRLVLDGPAFVIGAFLALPSGIGQQLLYLAGLFAPLEAAARRTDVAAVTAAFLFGLIHVPFVMDANHGDLWASAANAVLFQSSVGAVACLAYVRHRAVVPIGVAHALAIG